MKNLAHYTASLAITARVGGLWAIGYIAVSILFRTEGTGVELFLANQAKGEVMN